MCVWDSIHNRGTYAAFTKALTKVDARLALAESTAAVLDRPTLFPTAGAWGCMLVQCDRVLGGREGGGAGL